MSPTLILLCWLAVVVMVATEDCSLYLAPSTVPGAGRGIIAGKTFNKGQRIEETITITFKDSDCAGCQLDNYAYVTDDDEYSMIKFGAGSLYNHHSFKNVEYHWSRAEVAQPSNIHPEPYSVFTPTIFKAVETVKPGNELFVYYGYTWLQSRTLEDEYESSTKTSQITPIPVSDLEKYGHCLSHVSVNTSTIPNAGKGLYAERDFKAGEIVLVSPVLLLAREMVERTRETSVLMNYCFTPPGEASDIVLFPLNNAVALNHQPSGLANLDFDWYDWARVSTRGAYFEQSNNITRDLNALLRLSVDEVLSAPLAQFDLAFTALTDIAEGDELTINYGDSWRAAWELYGQDMDVWHAEYQAAWDHFLEENPDEDTFDASLFQYDYMTLPQFRSFIEVRRSMFPVHWLRNSFLEEL